MLIIMTIAILRVLLILAIFSYSLHLMSRLQKDQNRRRTNPPVRYALAMCASGGLGVVLLLLRRLLIWLYGPGHTAWWLLYRSPDRLGWMTYSLCECLVLTGTILFMIGIRRIVYYKVSLM